MAWSPNSSIASFLLAAISFLPLVCRLEYDSYGCIRSAAVMLSLGMIVTNRTQIISRMMKLVALARVSREIRSLQDDDSVVEATDLAFEFVTDSGKQVRYEQVDTDWVRTEDGGPEYVLAHYLEPDSLLFSYFDDQGNVLAEPLAGLGTSTDLRRIGITMTVTHQGQTESVHIYEVERVPSH